LAYASYIFTNTNKVIKVCYSKQKKLKIHGSGKFNNTATLTDTATSSFAVGTFGVWLILSRLYTTTSRVSKKEINFIFTTALENVYHFSFFSPLYSERNCEISWN